MEGGVRGVGCPDWAELCSLHTSLCGSCVLEIRESISLALGALDHGSREAVEEGQRHGCTLGSMCSTSHPSEALEGPL